MPARIHFILPIVAAFFALPASATTAYYCQSCDDGVTEAAFSSAVTAASPSISYATPITFGPTQSLVGSVTNVGATGVSFTAFTASNSASTLDVDGNGRLILDPTNPNSYIQIDFSSPVYAFGVHVTSSSSINVCVVVVLSAGCEYAAMSATPARPLFFGAINSAAPIATFYLKAGFSGSGQVILSDFGVGTHAAQGPIDGETPEPATWMLMAAGLAFLPLLRRRLS